MTSPQNQTLPDVLPSALETLIPGFPLFTRMVLLYFGVDVSTFSNHIFFFTLLFALFNFAVPRLHDNLQRCVLYFAASIEIKFESSLHGPLIKWLAENDQLNKCRRSIAAAKPNFAPPWKEDDADEEIQDEEPSEEQQRFERDKILFWQSQKRKGGFQPIRCTPGQNQLHTFRYQGYLIGLYRHPRPSLSNTWLTEAETITIFSWRKRTLTRLLEEVQETGLKRKGSRVAIYRGMKVQNMLRWALSSSKPPRLLSTLALDPVTKSEIVADIEEFLSPNTKVWYRSCGIPYRRGFLFHGPPGTGKSSMCFAIASLFCLDIYTISLNTCKIDEDSLSKLFQELPSRCIILLEDVDNAGMGLPLYREVNQSDETGFTEDKTVSHSGVSLSALLNCLDGVGAQEGRILIMTTNHPDKLDAALTRPSRVDKTFNFGYADTSSVESIFSLIYKPFIELEFASASCITTRKVENQPAGAMETQKILDLSIEFAELVPADQFTAAEIQSYLLGFKDEPDVAVKRAAEWVKDTMGVKSCSSNS
ncbi:hypothetical protein DTO013E5_52 [Penicillium roqueforti]|nr:hypothetical protein DTO012A1_1568 [Penicillium roqueforti]KAI2756598.1 hypothetical protein DTO013F2_13 [Penicillium roqueforti]KAI2766420.1 hypothetical protein DTO012A8_8358 [Penicillium roqueforti]KAI3218213.1 hypothetical protein DTO013E5_52 [Penicillium roqueforti]